MADRAGSPEQHRLFAVSAPGLKPCLRGELEALGLDGLPDEPPAAEETSWAADQGGGVELSGGLADIYRLNLHLRTATRVLLRLGEFRAVAFYELHKKARRLAWERFLQPGQPVALRVTCHKSRLYHSDAVAERVATSIGERLGHPLPLRSPGDEDEESAPPQLVVVRFFHDECTVSLDTSGASLHRRGYRLASAKAPLRETLAAGMLLAAGWDAASPLLDPFCGSGTIPIEAALLAAHIPPGGSRRFAFMDWPNFDPALWEGVRAEAAGLSAVPQSLGEFPPIQASDRDQGAVELARENAGRAGVAELVDFSCRAVSAIEPNGRGWVVTNPPYGVRLSVGQDLRNLYARFGEVLRHKCGGWRFAFLCSEPALARQTHLPLEVSLSTVNGGLPVRLYMGTVPG